MKTYKLEEKETRDKLIIPKLEKVGWINKENYKLEYAYTEGEFIITEDSDTKTPQRAKGKRVDILLYKNRYLPLAVIEIKSHKKSLQKGIQQAIKYASDLNAPFAYCTNGEGFIEHDMLNGLEKEIGMNEFPPPEELWNRFVKGKKYTKDQEEIITTPFFYKIGANIPRYYQTNAINKTIEAISQGQKKILLVMATGTGKTYTASQIIYILMQKKIVKKVLFLTDRNIIIDQTMSQDFKHFGGKMVKVANKTLDSAYEIYLSLYHQLSGEDGNEPFRKFAPEFFDLIVVDECHRGSAEEDSTWRKILDYFDKATKIGLTATPKETEYISNAKYFGTPVYTYSLKSGIEDGFLAPYRVLRVNIDKDVDGYRPPEDTIDYYGQVMENRKYDVTNYDRDLILDDRTDLVAKRITKFLKESDNEYAKTIVFCVDINHADRMRMALINENHDLVSEDNRYVMKITGDDIEGKKELENFIDEESLHPVIVTTSNLLTTGVDTKTCKIIVLDKTINSMIEFKQIIGRGTRIKTEQGKYFFTIIDFRNATKLFNDPAFDGYPVAVINENRNDQKYKKLNWIMTPETEKRYRKYRLKNTGASIVDEKMKFYDKDGIAITLDEIEEKTKEKILNKYETYDVFVEYWNSKSDKKQLIEDLENSEIFLERIKENKKYKDIGYFDFIGKLAYNIEPLTRKQRGLNVLDSGFLKKYTEKQQEILNHLLEKYMNENVDDIYDYKILENYPFKEKWTVSEIIFNFFEKRENYDEAINELQKFIYKK